MSRRVTVKDMVVLTDMSRNTLKEHFRKLVGNGQLTMQGKGRGAWYALRHMQMHVNQRI